MSSSSCLSFTCCTLTIPHPHFDYMAPGLKGKSILLDLQIGLLHQGMMNEVNSDSVLLCGHFALHLSLKPSKCVSDRFPNWPHVCPSSMDLYCLTE